MAAWGWRIPFLLGALGGLAGLWITAPSGDRSLLAQQEGGVEKQPLRTLLREHPVEVLRIVGFSILTTFAFYIFVAYVPTYAIRQVHADPKTAFAANTVALIVFMLVQPLFGAVGPHRPQAAADRVRRRLPDLLLPADDHAGPVLRLDPGGGTVRSGAVLHVHVHRAGHHVRAVPHQRARVGIGTPYNLVVWRCWAAPRLLTGLQSQGMVLVLLLRAGRRRDHADHLHHARDGRPEAPLRPPDAARTARGASAFRHRQVRKSRFPGSPMSAPDTALHFQTPSASAAPSVRER